MSKIWKVLKNVLGRLEKVFIGVFLWDLCHLFFFAKLLQTFYPERKDNSISCTKPSSHLRLIPTLGQSKSSADPVVKAAAAAAPEPAVKAAAAAGAAEPLVKAAAAAASDPLAKAAAAGASEPLVKAAAASVSEPAVKSTKTSKFDVAENSSLSEKSLLNPLSVAETAAEAGAASSSLDIKLESPSSPQPMPRGRLSHV